MESKVYNPNEIMEKLKISKASTYRYLQDVYNLQQPFRVIQIGSTYRVPKCSFDNWINSDVYKISDVQHILGISYKKALKLVQTAYTEKNMFKVVKVLTSYRISKDEFEYWLLQGYIT